MRELKFVVLVATFLGLCVGCYYIAEARHDDNLRTEYSDLEKKLEAKDALQAEIAAKTAKSNKLFLDAISVRWPENAEEFDKMYTAVEEKLAKAEKKADDEKAEVEEKPIVD